MQLMRFLWFLPFFFLTGSALRNGLPFDAPLFEPSVVAKGIQPSFLREAELKHGRLAMVSSIVAFVRAGKPYAWHSSV